MFKATVRSILKDDIFQLSCISGVIVNGIMWIALYLRVPATNEPIALQYNIYYGINLIGEQYKVFSLPVLGALILLLNIILSLFFYRSERLIAHILLVTAAAIQLVLIFASYLITGFI